MSLTPWAPAPRGPAFVEPLAADWCDFLSRQLRLRLPQDDSDSEVRDGLRARKILIRIATGYLPLPGLLSLALQSSTVKNGTFTLVYLGEPVAEISLKSSSQPDLEVVTTPREELRRHGHRIVGLKPYQVLSSSPTDPDWMFRANDSWSLPDNGQQHLALVGISWDKVKPSFKSRPLWFLKRDNCPLGVLLRIAEFGGDEQDRESSNSLGFSAEDIDVVAVTTNRFSNTRELLKSIRKFLPSELEITVVAQTRSTRKWRSLATRFDARLIHVEGDRGLSWSRNHAVSHTVRPIVFLMDDDFQVDSRCRLEDALAILNNHQEIAILGGNLLDVHHWRDPRSSEVSQGFAMRMIEGPPDIVWRRLEDAPRDRQYVNPGDYFEYCDIVDNFALIRRDAVFQRVEWNPSLKIGAEHQDLYIRMKLQGIGAVARTNTLKVRNVRVQSRQFRRMRERTNEFFPLFFEDLGLRSFHILGERKRTVTQEDGHVVADRRFPNGRYMPNRSKQRESL